MLIKYSLFAAAAILLSINSLAVNAENYIENGPDQYADLATFKWQHGSKSCNKDTNLAIQVVRANATSYVLRQNKCVSFEAPFIYVLFGRDKVLVLDTGATASPEKSPLYRTVRSLIQQQRVSSPNTLTLEPEILVVHSHSHSDHTKGDSQFLDKEGIEVVGASNLALATQLGLNNWPKDISTINLGGRELTLIPTPGHQEQSIAVYDEQTQWLLTGDSLYPGSIRIKSWPAYRSSIQRLFEFSQLKPISLILGSHIEFNTVKGKPYRVGTTYQPDEAPLAMQVNQLNLLNQKLQITSKPKKLTFESFVISPLSRFEKLLSNALR